MIENSEKKKLKYFGFIVGGIFLMICLLSFFIKQNKHPILFCLSVFLLSGAAFYPEILKKPYVFWMKIASVLGWINDKVILTLIYYFIFTPISLVRKLKGKDVLNQKWIKNCTSYRLTKNKRNSNHLKNQF
jgi:hypothetical protein